MWEACLNFYHQYLQPHRKASLAALRFAPTPLVNGLVASIIIQVTSLYGYYSQGSVN